MTDKKEQSIIARCYGWLLRRPRGVTVVFGLLALVSLFFAGRVTVDNTLEIWLMQGTPAYEDYQAFTGARGVRAGLGDGTRSAHCRGSRPSGGGHAARFRG
ncbi:MAG: hypothetical protein ACYTG7_21025 [Planctomycetota bacterium]